MDDTAFILACLFLWALGSLLLHPAVWVPLAFLGLLLWGLYRSLRWAWEMLSIYVVDDLRWKWRRWRTNNTGI